MTRPATTPQSKAAAVHWLSDRDFDRTAGIHSIPARFGVAGALAISAALHLVTAGALLALAPLAHLGVPYLTGVAVVIALLVYEHVIVRPADLSRLDVAFFLATLADVLLR